LWKYDHAMQAMEDVCRIKGKLNLFDKTTVVSELLKIKELKRFKFVENNKKLSMTKRVRSHVINNREAQLKKVVAKHKAEGWNKEDVDYVSECCRTLIGQTEYRCPVCGEYCNIDYRPHSWKTPRIVK
jgi:hypothetical protein